MARKFHSPQQLEKHLTMVMDNVIRTELKEAIVDIWLQVQQERVYDVYSPTRYERRGDEGGLADPDNIDIVDTIGFKNGVQYVLENITEGAGDSVGEKINALIEGKEGFMKGVGGALPARPYTEEAVQIINENPSSVKDALVKGFARHGIKINVT